MRRLVASMVVAVGLMMVLAVPAGAGRGDFPDSIPLPDGFQPEGVATGRGTDVFTGSLVDGTIWRGDLRTGAGDVLVAPADARTALGMEVDRRTNNLFVAGGPFGQGYVYDAGTGDTLAIYQLTSDPLTLVNDVVVTRRAVYFTDSFRPVLYRVPLGPGGELSDTVEELTLGGDFQFIDPLSDPNLVINANGIAVTPDGRSLVVVHTALGKLYRVDPATGHATEIDLRGGSVPNGDGLLLQGRKLYVVQNFLNQIGVVRLDTRLTSGKVLEPILSDGFRIPTTVDAFGPYLYAVNARFDVAPPPLAGTPPSPDVEFEIVQVRRHR